MFTFDPNCCVLFFFSTLKLAKECPVGWNRAEDQNVSACTQCKVGTTTANNGSASCAGCELGKFGSGPGVCQLCVSGRYNDAKGTVACKSCPIDTFYKETGATALSQCVACSTDRSTGIVSGSSTEALCLCRQGA